MYTKSEMIRICKALYPTATGFRVQPVVNAAMVDTSPDEPGTVMYFGRVIAEAGAAATFIGGAVPLEIPFWNSQANAEQFGHASLPVYRVFNNVDFGTIDFVGHKVTWTNPE